LGCVEPGQIAVDVFQHFLHGVCGHTAFDNHTVGQLQDNLGIDLGTAMVLNINVIQPQKTVKDL
jgi:hypothetical protein